jgi:hypothetical protein
MSLRKFLSGIFSRKQPEPATPEVKPPRFFSILVAGTMFSGKSTFIHTISHATGCPLPFQTQGSAIPGTYSGRVNVDDETTLLLFEPRQLYNVFELPGEWLGMIVITNSARSEFLRESLSAHHMFRIYAGIELPLVVVDNPHDYRYEGTEVVGGREYMPELAWDAEALRWALQLDSAIPVIQGDIRNTETGKAALAALLEYTEKSIPAEKYDKLPFEPVYADWELFTAERNNYWLYVVNADWAHDAHWFMDTLADDIVWLSPNPNRFPLRLGYCDIDEQTRLYIFPMENFGTPVNRVEFSLDTIMALTEKRELPNPVVKTPLDFVPGTIGCVGILNSFAEVSLARTRVLIDAAGEMPLVLVDNWYRQSMKPPPDDRSDLESAIQLEAHIPLLRAPKFDKPSMYAAMRLLAERLPGDLPQRFREKFAAENAADKSQSSSPS